MDSINENNDAKSKQVIVFIVPAIRDIFEVSRIKHASNKK
jgi:hypothetical protein